MKLIPINDSYGDGETDAGVRDYLFYELEDAVDRESKVSRKFHDRITSMIMRIQSKAYVRGYNQAVEESKEGS